MSLALSGACGLSTAHAATGKATTDSAAQASPATASVDLTPKFFGNLHETPIHPGMKPLVTGGSYSVMKEIEGKYRKATLSLLSSKGVKHVAGTTSTLYSNSNGATMGVLTVCDLTRAQYRKLLAVDWSDAVVKTAVTWWKDRQSVVAAQKGNVVVLADGKAVLYGAWSNDHGPWSSIPYATYMKRQLNV